MTDSATVEALWIAVGVLGGILLLVFVAWVRRTFCLPRLPSGAPTPGSGDPSDELQVFTSPPAFVGASGSVSPFCGKLETFLRLAEIPYKPRRANLQKAPKGKMPYISHGKSGTFGDSELIIQYLCETYAPGADRLGRLRLPASLAPRDRAAHTALKRMVEESLYFAVVNRRWVVQDDSFEVMKTVAFSGIPCLIRPCITSMVRRGVRDSMVAQGVGRHVNEDADRLAFDAIDALAEFLGDQAFLFGDEATPADCTAFSCLANIVEYPTDTPLKRRVLGHATLLAYINRIRHVMGMDDVPDALAIRNEVQFARPPRAGAEPSRGAAAATDAVGSAGAAAAAAPGGVRQRVGSRE